MLKSHEKIIFALISYTDFKDNKENLVFHMHLIIYLQKALYSLKMSLFIMPFQMEQLFHHECVYGDKHIIIFNLSENIFILFFIIERYFTACRILGQIFFFF